MSIEEKYKKLTEVEHVLARPARYVGTINATTNTEYHCSDGKFVLGEMTWSPAFLKLFDEVISNSVDFSKTKEGKHLTRIEVTVSPITGEITVMDNGGIPVVKHTEYDQWLPDMLFGELRSGSNFDDDDESVSTGQNGEGVSLVNIFSEVFKLETADGKNKFEKVWKNNSMEGAPAKIAPSSKKFTRVSYIPDYKKLGVTLNDDHVRIIIRRTWEIAACAANLQVFLNGKQLKVSSFKEFLLMHDPDIVYTENKNWNVGVSPSQTGFVQTSWVNSTKATIGGTHIDYVMNQIVGGIRDFIKKKTKQDLKPSDIKNHFHLFVNCVVHNPRYNSQTKENLETLPSQYGTSIQLDAKFFRELMKSSVVTQIIEWAERKQQMDELREAKKANKNNVNGRELKKLTKYETATSKNRSDCTLVLTEGDSAALSVTSARNPKTMGVFPLRGKIISVADQPLKKILQNKEIQAIISILGLKVGEEPDPKKLRYGKIVIATDADHDGSHILGLVCNMFFTLWPSLYKFKMIFRFKTPVLRAVTRTGNIEFFELAEYAEWAKKKVPHKTVYLKGLGSINTDDFSRYLKDPSYTEPMSIQSEEDIEALDLAFNKDRADDRKTWIIARG